MGIIFFVCGLVLCFVALFQLISGQFHDAECSLLWGLALAFIGLVDICSSA